MRVTNVSRVYVNFYSPRQTCGASALNSLSDDEELEDMFQRVVLVESTLCGSTAFMFTKHDQIKIKSMHWQLCKFKRFKPRCELPVLADCFATDPVCGTHLEGGLFNL